jgi:signal transduction histidine kinase
MRFRDLARRQLPAAIAALLVVLLAVLAVLQWRWTGEVSAMERQRMRAGVLAAGTRFAEDFDKEVTRAFLFFHFFHPEPPPETAEEALDRVVRQYDRWNAEAPYPGLVRDVFVVGRMEGGEPQIAVLRPAEHRFVHCAWPAELDRVRQHLQGHQPPPHPSLAMFGMVVPALPGLVIPLGFPGPHGPAAHPERAHLAGAHLIVRLDLRTITSDILPTLTRLCFGGSPGHATDYVLAVVDSAAPEKVIYRSDPNVPAAAFRSSDARLEMLELRRFEELRSLWSDEGVPHDVRRRMSHFPHWGPPPGAMEHARVRGGWTLLIKHRNGSLEETVAAIRWRNLAVSLGILALLGATAGMLMVTTQRAQRLARQQIEFVAGVTHELNTPLTAMRSAGQNLADGVVTEPEQVRRYGTLIESEGRRLSNMVGQALEFAGIQSGRRVYHPQPVEAEEIVDGALQDSRWLLQEKRVEVEREVEPGLPPVLADAAALRRAVQNLLENAVKYGGQSTGQSGWIGVRARRASSGEVEITVADRGPGIRREDLPHLFEPFFRGRDAAATSVPGSGLGLSLVRHTVEAHGGRVTVDSTGEGSAFTLRLPAAASAARAPATVEEPA